MGAINSTLGANIRLIRSDSGMTQQDLADRVTAICGESVSRVMIAKWERGETMISAEMAHYISKALGVSSYKLWPHSDIVSDKDVELISRINELPDDEKDDLLYLLTKWHGDTRALLKLDVAHAVLPEWRRTGADTTIIEEYKDAVRTNDPNMDHRIDVDLAYILKAFRKINK